MPKFCKTIYTNIIIEMFKKHENQNDLSKALEMSKNALVNKLKGRTDWTISEIDKLCKHYGKDYYYLFHKDSE